MNMISRNRFQFQGFGLHYRRANRMDDHDGFIDRNEQECLSGNAIQCEKIPCQCDARIAKKKTNLARFILAHESTDDAQTLEQNIETKEREAKKPTVLKVTYNLDAEEGEKFSLTACKKSNKRKFDEFCMKTCLPIDVPRLDISQVHIKWRHPDLMNMINIDDVETVDRISVNSHFQQLVRNANGLDELVSLNFQGIVRSFADAQGKINKLIYLHTFYSIYNISVNENRLLDADIIKERLTFLEHKLSDNSPSFFDDKYGLLNLMPETDDRSQMYIFRLKTFCGSKVHKCHKEFLFRANAGKKFQGIMSVGDIKKHLISQIENVDFNSGRAIYGDLYVKSTDLDSLHEDLVYTRSDNEHTRILPNLLHNDIIED